jgi:hypothetical protein
MFLGLQYLPSPYSMAAFTLGGVILSTDYDLLRVLGLDDIYRWIEANEGIHERARRNYAMRKFIRDGPDRITLHVETEGNLRAVVPGDDMYFEGMRFRVCVDEPSTNTDEDLEYHLRIGTATVTRISESSDSRQTLFLSIDTWESTFEDDRERRRIQRSKEGLLRGDIEEEVFAKPLTDDSLNEFTISEWRAIRDWSERVRR